ncbi:ribosomal RNA small subunit methyltransferase E [Marinithermofilum abyssi]|uniref:Ribosomal RNA small subunit methyltransferase E n=1 Tax=Marinithermofilum abyssi TaxID=1571185 RepID=A0A8J2YD39_9BACL|nr:16S rRNA (uracil(1498)-N(3))-methyltransferase [Marinithermofilum abyssi]GGE14567.1 ribosomal RNA small subunit methyltransferase E [Marinithermofilum abyssi]
MQRYFVNQKQIETSHIVITGDDVHHIKNVMRLVPGDHIICCDGTGQEYLVRIEALDPEKVRGQIEETRRSKGEPAVSVTVSPALLKGDKLDWVLQKGTELGAVSFLPFTSQRTIVKLDGKKAVKRRERWQKIVKEAAEQSRRGRIPEVHPLSSWEGLLSQFTHYDRVLFAYEKGGQPLTQVLEPRRRDIRYLIVLGPEGGFSETEAEAAQAQGARIVGLGSRILRAETASLACLTSILFAHGEIGGEPL